MSQWSTIPSCAAPFLVYRFLSPGSAQCGMSYYRALVRFNHQLTNFLAKRKLFSFFCTIDFKILIFLFFFLFLSISFRDCLERSVQSVHWTTEIFCRRRNEITTRCTYCQSRCWRGPIVYRSVLSRRMGLEHLVGRQHGPLSQ